MNKLRGKAINKKPLNQIELIEFIRFVFREKISSFVKLNKIPILFSEMKKYGFKTIKFLGYFFLFLLLLAIAMLDTVDRTPYKQTAYYQNALQNIENWSKKQAIIQKNNPFDSIQVSWARESITPSFAVPLSGYSARKGKPFESMADSVWVRAFVLKNSREKIAVITADLLIVPPLVRQALAERLPKIGFSLEKTYLSATHTHSSLGAWGDTFAGYMIAGEYQPEIIDMITEAIIRAISKAEKSLEKGKIGFGQAEARDFVENRLTDEGTIDPYFRWLVFEKKSGKKAILCTFAAHATCYGSGSSKLSGDYPAALVAELEKTNDFAAYMAGAVGSQACTRGNLKSEERLNFMAKGLAQKYNFDSSSFEQNPDLQAFRLPLPLNEPHFRIHKDIRFRPYLFHLLVGNDPAELSFLQIGKTILVGTPCDFSGELMSKISKADQNIMLTSFNGGYIGYITADEWYDLEAYETLSMNWFGAHNGAYMTEYINHIVKKLK